MNIFKKCQTTSLVMFYSTWQDVVVGWSTYQAVTAGCSPPKLLVLCKKTHQKNPSIFPKCPGKNTFYFQSPFKEVSKKSLQSNWLNAFKLQTKDLQGYNLRYLRSKFKRLPTKKKHVAWCLVLIYPPPPPRRVADPVHHQGGLVT